MTSNYKNKTIQSAQESNLIQLAKRCHNDLPEKYRDYFKRRGLTDASIDKYYLGYGNFYNQDWLIIPIFSAPEVVDGLRLRRLPEEDDSTKAKYKFCSKKKPYNTRLIGGYNAMHYDKYDNIFICEGELDRILLEQQRIGMPVVTSSAGANTFKEKWITEYLQYFNNIYICFDNDDTGRKASRTLAEKIEKMLPDASVFNIELPQEVGDKGDITDYFQQELGSAKDLLSLAKQVAGPQPIDTSNLKEMSLQDLNDILGLTIKHDDVSKQIVFLGMLSTYTEEDQLNICLNAQSSTGKTYIVQEVAKFFPKQDILSYSKVTPSAFFYKNDDMKINPQNGHQVLDMERKILIFLDAPDMQVQQNLRPLLSHDQKEISFLNTNKDKQGGNTSKDKYILGFPSVFYCSANMRIDEQEATRFFLLSPENSPEKIQASLQLQQQRQANPDAFDREVATNTERTQLQNRILDIRRMHINHVYVQNQELVNKLFVKALGQNIRNQPRAQRDIAHFYSLIKSVALLNARFRRSEGRNIYATDADIHQAFELWSQLVQSIRYGIPPQILDFLNQIIIPAYQAKQEKYPNADIGITVTEIIQYHYMIKGVPPNGEMLRKQYLPILQQVSLLTCRKSFTDKRVKEYIPNIKYIKSLMISEKELDE